MFPTGMLETSTQRKILRVLAEKNKRHTISDLAELCHRSEASVSRALGHADRYPFLEKGRVKGSKQLTFRLDPDSRYTAGIRAFFDVEREQERQSGMVPVDIWNLLEDVTERFENQVEGFVEVFLYGSYATGDYYAGSDIDLLLAHANASDVKETIDGVVEEVGDQRLQVIPVNVPEAEQVDDERVLELVADRSPAGELDVLVPLSGEVSQ